MLFQDIRLLAHEVFEELSQHQCCSLILLFLSTQLLIDFKAVVLHFFIVSLRISQLLLYLFQLHFKEVNELLALKIVRVLLKAFLHSLTTLLLLHHTIFLPFESFNLTFKTCNVLLRLVGTLR